MKPESSQRSYSKFYFFAGLLLGVAVIAFYSLGKNLKTSPFMIPLTLMSVALLSLNLALERKGRIYTLLVTAMVIAGSTLIVFHYYSELPKVKYQLELVNRLIVYVLPLLFVYGVSLLPVGDIFKRSLHAAFFCMLCYLIVLPLQDNVLSMTVVGVMSGLLFLLVLKKEDIRQHLGAALVFVGFSLVLCLIFFPLRVFAKAYSVIMLNWLLQTVAVFMVFAFKNIRRLPNE